MAKQYTLTANDRQSVLDAASALGVDPGDLVTAIRYETAGTFNPGVVGGDNNHFQGLIQFGPRERKAFGVTPGMSFADQIRGPVVSYLKARGVQPGMNYDQIYTAINYGNIFSGKVPYGFRDGSGRTLAENIRNGLAGRDEALAALYGTGGVPDGPARTLRKGDVGDDVAALQYRLANVGLYTGPIDGKFGPQTAEAVRAVQRNANLHLDTGIAGPEVYAALANAGPSVFAAANGPAAAAPVSTAEYGFGSPLASGSFAGPQLAQAGTASAAGAPVQLAQSGGARGLAATGLFSQAPQVAFGGGAVGARAPVQLAQGGRAGGIFAAPQVAQSGGAGSAFRQPTPQLASAGGASGQRATQVAMSPTLRTKDDAFSPASSASTRVVSAFSTRAPNLGSAGSAGSAVRPTNVAVSPQASVQRVSYTPAVTRLVSPAAAYNASPAPVGMAMSALGGAEKTQSINPFGTKLANLGAAAEAVAPQQTTVRRVVTAPAAVTYKPSLVPQASLMPQATVKKEMPNGLFGKIMQNLPVAKAVNGLGNLVSPFNTGAAVDYGMVQPKTNAFAVSPFTPVGFNTPDFTPKSGGAVYAYQTSAPGVGSYINSAGRTMNYNVNADQRVYGNYSGGFGGFQP